MTQPLLRALRVARRYGDVEALAPTDLELAPGEAVALAGPNGAGKSTLLGILAGAIEPSEGSVEMHARVGWAPQRPAHYARLSARENLELFARLERVPNHRRAAAGMLERFALPAGTQPSGELSVGNRQRLNVALALLAEPRVLLLDEPTAALDPGQRRRVWEVADALRAEGGAVCFATQNLEELEHATRAIVLQDGRVVSLTVEEVFGMTPVLLLLRKDLRLLRRSPLLLGALVAYPIVIALLVGLVAGYASSKPRVAFVDEDDLPSVVAVAGHRFHLQTVIDDVAGQVTLVRLSPGEAARELADGKVVATITVPPGFLGDLETTVVSPHLILKTGSGGLAPRVTQQMQSLVYQLNQKLQGGYIAANLAFVNLLLHGGHGAFIGKTFDVLGLDRTAKELAALRPSKRIDAIEHFVAQAKVGLAQTGDALRATANPITLQQASTHGRTWLLSAQVQSYGIAVTVTFLALLLAAGATAAERDEGTIGRLRRGLVTLGQLVWSKVALAAIVGLVLGAAIAIVFGIVVDVGGVTGGEPWSRLPLLLAGVLLAAAAVGAAGTLLGALAREARTASLLAVLLVLPVVFLGLVPRGALPLAYWISLFLPFAHAARLFGAALYDTNPWRTVGVEAAWLVGIGAASWALARVSARTLSA